MSLPPSSDLQRSRTLLVVEDDATLALGLSEALELEGFRVVHVARAKDALIKLHTESPDCILLDVMLPDLSGYQVCSEIRTLRPDLPIIMLTARGQEADKIRGFFVGADDYVTKPFSAAELTARIRAVLRRTDKTAGTHTSVFRIGPAQIDPTTQTLKGPHGTSKLSFYEVQLLRMLWERSPAPVSRDELRRRVWQSEASPTNRSVDNVIVKLRKKIEPNPDEPKYILTIYGIGYKAVLSDDDSET